MTGVPPGRRSARKTPRIRGTPPPVNAPGTGVPPARANSTNVARTGTKPTITSAAPPARTTIQAGDWYSTFQPVIAHGTQTAPTPAASTNHAMLSTALTDL